MSDLRPIDGNGHVPDEPFKHSAEWLAGHAAGYELALLKISVTLLERAHVDATLLLDRINELAA